MNSKWLVRWGAVVVVALTLASLGCSARPATQPTKKEVQKDTDRFFDRLQTEEQDRKQKEVGTY